jgi:phosphoesterase RecJ-like protein
MQEKILHKLDAAFGGATNILITSHVRPDGDAVASVLALGLSLRAEGKDVVMALQDGVPTHFEFLEGWDEIVTRHGGGFDLVVTLDSGDRDRVGQVLNGLEVDVNIDHHPTNPGYGDINVIDEFSVATCEMLANLLPALNLPMPPAVVNALLTGILTDSQGFSTLNTTAGVLRCAADLVERGADLPQLYFKALSRNSFHALRFWGEGLTSMQRQDGVVWATLSLEGRERANYPGRDDASLVNYLATIDSADIAVVFVQQSESQFKISWRAKAGFNVAAIAQGFGGGGHIPAAGATVDGTLEEVQKRVLEATFEVVRAAREKETVN